MNSSALSLTRRWGLVGPVCSNRIPLPSFPSGRRKTVQRALVLSSAASSLDKWNSDTTCNHSHTRSGSVWGFLRFYLRVGDEHLFQIVWGWTPSVVPATSCFWGCSRSRSSCGCCSETHRCDTTVHTEHTHKQMQLWVFKKWKIIRTMQKQNLK